jgi:DNA repair protein RadC
MKKDAIFDGQTEMKRVEPHKGSGHRERLREKFLTSGLSGFHDYEVIELLLTHTKGYIIYLFQ